MVGDIIATATDIARMKTSTAEVIHEADEAVVVAEVKVEVDVLAMGQLEKVDQARKAAPLRCSNDQHLRDHFLNRERGHQATGAPVTLHETSVLIIEKKIMFTELVAETGLSNVDLDMRTITMIMVMIAAKKIGRNAQLHQVVPEISVAHVMTQTADHLARLEENLHRDATTSGLMPTTETLGQRSCFSSGLNEDHLILHICTR